MNKRSAQPKRSRRSFRSVAGLPCGGRFAPCGTCPHHSVVNGCPFMDRSYVEKANAQNEARHE